MSYIPPCSRLSFSDKSENPSLFAGGSLRVSVVWDTLYSCAVGCKPGRFHFTSQDVETFSQRETKRIDVFASLQRRLRPDKDRPYPKTSLHVHADGEAKWSTPRILHPRTEDDDGRRRAESREMQATEGHRHTARLCELCAHSDLLCRCHVCNSVILLAIHAKHYWHRGTNAFNLLANCEKERWCSLTQLHLDGSISCQ